MFGGKWEKLARGRPSREGNMLFGRPIPVGDDAPAGRGIAATRAFRAGELGRPTFEVVGDIDRKVRAGDAGRASFDIPATAGLVGLAITPIRVLDSGEPGRGIAAVKRAICGGGAGASFFSGLIGPVTRRNLSSNCVLSLGDKGPTNDHTFSPTRAYPSLQAGTMRWYG